MEARWGGNFDARRPLATLGDAAAHLRHFFGDRQGIIVNAVGNAAPDVVLRLWLALRGYRWIYDVYDWFLYDATGVKWAQWWLTDRAYRLIAARSCTLSQDLLPYYSGAFHLENASHLIPSRRPKRFDGRLVVTASYDRRTDFDFLRDLAEAAPDLAIDMYGSIYADDAPTAAAIAALTARAHNIHYHGRFEFDQLQSILDGYRIGVVPYRVADVMTRFINPDKVFHYLCAGLEVVMTPIPAARHVERYVHSADDAPAALAAIRRVVEQGQQRNPGNLHEIYNWRRRAREFCEALKPQSAALPFHERVERPSMGRPS